MNSEATRWPVGNADFRHAAVAIQPDGYHIVFRTSYGHLATNPAYIAEYGSMIDTRAEVDVAKSAGGDDNGVGLVCRLTDSGGYWLWAGTDGTAGISRVNVVAGSLSTVLTWNAASLLDSTVPAPQQHYHLTAECVGTSLRLLVDGAEVAEYQTQSAEAGYFGLAASTNEAEGDFVFSNLVVSKP